MLTIPALAVAQSWRTATTSRLPRGEHQLRVEVAFAAGTFRLHPGEADRLYHAAVRYDEEHFASTTTYDAEHGRLVIEVKPAGGLNDLDLDHDAPQFLEVALTPAVPLALKLGFGAAEAEIELGGLSLRRAEVETGASKSTVAFSQPNRTVCERLEVAVGAAELSMAGLGNARCEHIEVAAGAGSVTLDFGGSWKPGFATRAQATMGFGALTLRLPEGLGVEINLKRLFASFQPEGFVKRGSRYLSANYDDASSKLVLEIEAVIGDINVEWVPTR